MVILAGFAFQNTYANNTETNELIQDFRADIYKLVSSGNYTWDEAIQIMNIHDVEIDLIISQAEIDSNQYITGAERQAAKEYLLLEEIKYNQILVNDEKAIETVQGNEIETNDPELFGYFFPSAFATCDKQPKLFLFRQSEIDLYGDQLNGYDFLGYNKLLSVDRMILDDCSVAYTLTFKDEDHPSIDMLYDIIRQNTYNRIQDVEIFYIQNGNEIRYDNIWSDGKEYDYLKYGLFGQHANH